MPFREDLLNPISDSQPGGVSLRYDPVADQIREAQREDAEMPQGQWKTTLKVADYPRVIKLAGEAIATRGKDLQIAVWLVEAHVKREGFAALAPGFRFLHGLLEGFWETLHPELEDGDAELRAAPLEWLGSNLPAALRGLPLTSNKMTWINYKVSRDVGYEDKSAPAEKRTLRQQLINEGKPTAEEFDQAADETPKAFCEALAAHLSESLETLAALIDLCDSKFGDVSPSFVKTRGAVEEIARLVQGFVNKKGGPTPVKAPAAPPPEPAATPPPSPVAATPVASAPTAAAAAPAREPQPAPALSAEPASKEDAAERLAVVARYLRQKDIYDISPFLILRGHRWGEIRYNGPQIDITMLEAPPPELRKQVKQAALDSDWDGVLQATEAAMELPCGRGWLDIQRYTVKALEAKGEYFKFVADAVRTSLRGLLQDLPGIETLTLTDDTPTANPETLAWIREEVLPETVAAPSADSATPLSNTYTPEPPPPPAPAHLDVPPALEDTQAASPAVPDPFSLALEAAQSGRLREATEILSAELERARSGRGRFNRRMQLAHIFMASGRENIAYPILQDLAEEIDRRKLDEWESGDVLAHPLMLLLKCAASLSGDEELRKGIYARICRLDPKQALEAME